MGRRINTQKTLPFGTTKAVKAEGRQRLEIFAPGGGFVFGAIHNVQQPTPLANILAIFEAVRMYCTAYPHPAG